MTPTDSTVQRIRTADRFYREIQFILDLLALVVAFALAYLLRFDFRVPAVDAKHALIQLPLVLVAEVAAAYFTGIYSFIWRYIGLRELRAFGLAAILSSLPLLALRFGLGKEYQEWRIPLAVILLNAALAFGGMLMLRVLRRMAYERGERLRRFDSAPPHRRKPVLLIGAGRAGVLTAREVQSRGDLDIEVVGFIDDDVSKVGGVIQGIRILGTTDQLEEFVAKLNVDHVIITIAEADRGTIRGIVEHCERIGVGVQIIPGLYEILDRRVSVSRFRSVQIEDLLGRDPVRLDNKALQEFLTGKCVVVTGAGGSIGSELARQVARFRPSHLVLIERAEGALFEIDRELGDLWPGLKISSCIADIADSRRIRSLFARFKPQVVLHAAAHKHVPLMETNAVEAAKNNVLATRSLAQLAEAAEVETFVLISTDKAVRPSSIMGASKRLAELALQDANGPEGRCRLIIVRFGNVLGSTGSVVPIFRRQILQGGPVTVTHPDAHRYFMTIPEAAQLVLQASVLGSTGQIMILDMGEPIRVLDLAEDMIRLSGHEPYSEVKIVFTGLRPGEKLFEELQADGEEIVPTKHPKILCGRLQPLSGSALEEALIRLERFCDNDDSDAVRALLHEILPNASLLGDPTQEATQATVDQDTESAAADTRASTRTGHS